MRRQTQYWKPVFEDGFKVYVANPHEVKNRNEQIVGKIEALGYSRQWQLLQTVPGIKENSDASVLAEVGPDMGQFGSEKNLSSWAGVCPGNNRSAGKNKSSKTTKGNRWLRVTLTECAWGASGKKDCFLKQKFWRLATKKQCKPPATIAIAHTLLVLCQQDEFRDSYNHLIPNEEGREIE